MPARSEDTNDEVANKVVFSHQCAMASRTISAGSDLVCPRMHINTYREPHSHLGPHAVQALNDLTLYYGKAVAVHSTSHRQRLRRSMIALPPPMPHSREAHQLPTQTLELRGTPQSPSVRMRIRTSPIAAVTALRE